MEDDDLEYDITFPSPNTADLDGSNPDCLLNRTEPVVILLGWLGCKEKYLLKYGEIYDQAGLVFALKKIVTPEISLSGNFRVMFYVNKRLECDRLTIRF